MIDKSSMEILVCDRCGSFLHPDPKFMVSESDALRFEATTGIKLGGNRLLGHWICRRCEPEQKSQTVPITVDEQFKRMSKIMDSMFGMI